jgi:hypothetical protein
VGRDFSTAAGEEAQQETALDTAKKVIAASQRKFL